MKTISASIWAVSCLSTVVFALQAPDINPAADAFLSANNPNTNYGKAGALGVAGSAAANTKGVFDSVIKFDLTSTVAFFDSAFAGSPWTVSSIKLKLTTANPNNPVFNSPNVIGQFSVTWMQNDSWQEGAGTPMATETSGTGITYSTRPSGPVTGLSNYLSGADELLGTFLSDVTTGNVFPYPLNLTSSFLADATAGHVVSLLMLPVDPTVAYLFNSVDNTTPASRPVLIVEAVAAPEPGPGTLLAGAALVWLARRRRHAGAA